MPACGRCCTDCPASTRSGPRPGRRAWRPGPSRRTRRRQRWTSPSRWWTSPRWRGPTTRATRSIKKDWKRAPLDLAVAMVDLTTLEGADPPGKVRGLCVKAMRPDPADPAVPPVAAVCVYPDLVGVAKDELGGSRVVVASVATAFPSGRASLAVKLADVADAVAAGADEIDMVIDRGAFLAGRYGQVYEDVRAVKEACGSAHLKVILETGELATLDNVSRASWLAMLSGADFIKTS